MKINCIVITPHFGTEYSDIEIKGFMKTSEIPSGNLCSNDYKLVLEKISKNVAEEARKNSFNLAIKDILKKVSKTISCKTTFYFDDERLNQELMEKLQEMGFTVKQPIKNSYVVVTW